MSLSETSKSVVPRFEFGLSDPAISEGHLDGDAEQAVGKKGFSWKEVETEEKDPQTRELMW